MFYCMFYFTYDRSLITNVLGVVVVVVVDVVDVVVVVVNT